MGPDSANMVHRATLEASNSNNPEFGWKTVTKGKRSKKPAARNSNEITKVGNRSSKKLDGSVTKKLVSNGVDRIPPKKRHVLRTPSELQTLALVKEDPVSPQPHTPSPHGDSKPQSKVFCKSSVVKSRDDRVDIVSEELDQKLYNPEDFSGIDLLAAAAGIDLDDSGHFKVLEEHSIVEKADMSASREPVKCSISIEPQTSPSDVVKIPQSMQVNEDVAVRKLKAPKVNRLHWDLNLEMDAWEQPLDLSDHNLDFEKLEGDGCKVSAISDCCHITDNHRPLVEVEQVSLGPENIINRASLGIPTVVLCPTKSMNDLAGQEISSNLDSVVRSHQVSSVSIDEQPGTESENMTIVRETEKVTNQTTPLNDAKDSLQNNEVAVLESSQHDSNINSCDPTCISAKVGSSVDDGRCSDVSQGNGSNTAGSKDQDGNDSPYEDGELRLSMPCPWLETESDYGYNECVDYESDGADYPGSEVVEAGSDGSLGVEKQSIAVKEEALVPELNRGSLKSNMNEDVDKSKVEYFMRRRHSLDHSGGIEPPKWSHLQQNRSRAYSRPTGDGGPHTFMDRQRSHFHVRERSGEDDQWNGQWGSKSNISSGYRGPAGRNYNRPRNMTVESEKFGESKSRDYSSKAPFRVDDRRFPHEKEDFYRGRNRTATNNNRSMGNSENYTQEVSRGNRNDSYDLSSNRVPRYFPRPEPSYSPPSAKVSRKRFRSRSRSLSPCEERRYNKSRSPCINRKYYRSPEFRSPARGDRVSMPFHKPNFPADQPGSGRGHYSPKRNHRWVDDRNFVENPRNRSSPVRAPERIGRFNSVGSDGRHKEENYFRPGNWPRRFPDAGRGRNFGEKYDDRRNDMHHWTRYSDANIAVGRCKDDHEDNFDGKITRKDYDIRNTEHRDVARSSHEDGSFKE